MNCFQNALTLMLLFAWTVLPAQKKLMDRANDYYREERFAEAIPMYEEALKTTRNLSAENKLAFCYRMNNRMDSAEAVYARVVVQEKAPAKSFFYYAEALMSNGKYEQARQWFDDYTKLEPDDEQGQAMIRACEVARHLQPYFPAPEVQPFPFNSAADDSAPVHWQGGLVFSSDRNQGLKLLKQKSGWTGRDFLQLYVCAITDDSLGYAEPQPFSTRLNELNKNTSNASFTADGRQVFFTRNSNASDRQDYINLQLFSAETDSLTGAGTRANWRHVERLPFCNPEHNYMHPAIAADGKRLVFVSDKPNGEGQTDLYISERTEKGWSTPINLGAGINTAGAEGFPFWHPDGRLFFCSRGLPGMGGFDLFVTWQDSDGLWVPPLNLGPPVNSPQDDLAIFLEADGQSGWFTSSRSGGDDDIYVFRIKGQ